MANKYGRATLFAAVGRQKHTVALAATTGVGWVSGTRTSAFLDACK
ncbi:hypothetical protein [Dyella sp.]|nr:hypothetical protein [Dyella sp.]